MKSCLCSCFEPGAVYTVVCEALSVYFDCAGQHKGQATHVQLCRPHQRPVAESNTAGHSDGHRPASPACHAQQPHAHDVRDPDRAQCQWYGGSRQANAVIVHFFHRLI